MSTVMNEQWAIMRTVLVDGRLVDEWLEDTSDRWTTEVGDAQWFGSEGECRRVLTGMHQRYEFDCVARVVRIGATPRDRFTEISSRRALIEAAREQLAKTDPTDGHLAADWFAEKILGFFGEKP